jgi:hypothetical protein
MKLRDEAKQVPRWSAPVDQVVGCNDRKEKPMMGITRTDVNAQMLVNECAEAMRLHLETLTQLYVFMDGDRTLNKTKQTLGEVIDGLEITAEKLEQMETKRFIIEYFSHRWKHSHNSGHEGFFETREDAQAALTPASTNDGFRYRIRQK